MVHSDSPHHTRRTSWSEETIGSLANGIYAINKTEGNNPLSNTEDFSEAAQSNQAGLTHLIRAGENSG